MRLSGSTYQPKQFVLPLLALSACIFAAILYDQVWLMWMPSALLLLTFFVHWSLHNPHALFWVLLCSLPLSTEYNLTPSLGLDLPDELCMILLTAMALAYWLFAPRSFPACVWQHSLFAILVLHVLWIGITIFASTVPVLSIKFLLAKIWYIVPFVILPAVWIRSVKQTEWLAKALLYPMVIIVILVLLQHATTGFSFETVNKHLSPFFRNHVNYAAMLVCLLAIAWAMYQLTPLHAWQKRRWIRAGLLLGLIALVFAYSRGAWIALVAGGITVVFMRKRWMVPAICFSLILILAAIAWLSTEQRYFRFAPDHDRTVFHTNFGEHMNATLALKDVSNAERFHRWVAGARMVAERPLVGFGPSSFYSQYQSYTVADFRTWVSNNPEHSTVHNYYLLTALEQGLPGLLIFLTLFIAVLCKLQYLYHALHNRFWQVTALVTAVVLVMIAVINGMSDMIETDKIGSLFWLSLGMVIVLDTKLKEEKNSWA